MKFIALIKGPEAKNVPQALFDAINEFMKEAGDKLLWTGGLMNTASAAILRPEGGKVRVTDGPFTEAKELIGGFAVYDVATREEALAWSRKFVDLHIEHYPEWPMQVEVRELFEAFPFRT